MELIDLAVNGPYHLRSKEGSETFDPPSKRGVFLRTIRAGDRYRIAFVGQSRDLRRGLRREIVALLGGGRAIYPPAELGAATKVPNPVYSGKGKDALSTYLSERERLSSLAHQNVMTYDFFWARVQGKRKVRQTVESAIRVRALELGAPIQDAEATRPHDKTERTIIRPQLPAGIAIEGLEEELRYGVRILPDGGAVQVRPEDYSG